MTMCPTLGKRSFETAAEARAKAHSSLRPYHCHCGKWHMATRSKRKAGRNPMVSGPPGRRIYYQSTTKWVA